jgi:hypothetical protein
MASTRRGSFTTSFLRVGAETAAALEFLLVHCHTVVVIVGSPIFERFSLCHLLGHGMLLAENYGSYAHQSVVVPPLDVEHLFHLMERRQS